MTDKNSVADWDDNPSLNDNIAGIPLNENQTYPRMVNNAFRAVMAQVHAWGGAAVERTPEYFKAVGDGVADDRAPLEAASDWLNGGPYRSLVMVNRYRVGRRTAPYFTDDYRKEGAITILEPDHTGVEFLPGAALLMDNLDGGGEGDQFHGICVRGPGSHVRILNPVVEWVSKPTARTDGDGIRFYGYPSDTDTGAAGDGLLSRIFVSQAYVKWAPQAGVIFHGCSDIMVESVFADETLADGCHLNACRRATIGSVHGNLTGDDACAFVTYWDATDIEGADPGIGPYSQTTLTEWCGSQSTVGQVTSLFHEVMPSGDGLRLLGTLDCRVGYVYCQYGIRAFVADAGKIDMDHAFPGMANRACRVDTIIGRDCQIGFLMYGFGVTWDEGDSDFWRNDISIGTLILNDCSNHGIDFQHIDGIHIDNLIMAGSNIDLRDIQGVIIDNITIDNATPKGNRIVGRTDSVTFGTGTRPTTDLRIGDVKVTGDNFEVFDCTGFRLGDLDVTGAPESAVVLLHDYQGVIGHVTVNDTNRTNDGGANKALSLQASQRITIDGLSAYQSDANSFLALEFGGASTADELTTDCTIRTPVEVFDPLNTSADASTVQGGTYAAVRCNFQGSYWHGGEVSPIMRYFSGNWPF